MIEDKLTAEQRIRLESVAQANVCIAQVLGNRPRTTEDAAGDLLARAEQIARWIKSGAHS